MNGRLYDPAVGRFLSADPIIQDAGNTQNYNRYSYCLNNPLKYTDPSGYQIRKNDADAWAEAMTDRYGDFMLNYGGGSGGGGGSLTPHLDQARKTLDRQQALRNAILMQDDKTETFVQVGFYYYDENGKPVIDANGDSGMFWIYEATEYNNIYIPITRSGNGFSRSALAGQGGDYSVWQNAAEKSGYASSTLGGLGNTIYSEYKGVERWVGKNGNYYNSAKVRMNGGYVRSAQLAKSASMAYKIAGHSMTALSVGFTAVEFAYSDKSAGDYARLVSAGIGVGLGFVPVIGPGLSIIYGIADSAGAFNGIYYYFDQ